MKFETKKVTLKEILKFYVAAIKDIFSGGD